MMCSLKKHECKLIDSLHTVFYTHKNSQKNYSDLKTLISLKPIQKYKLRYTCKIYNPLITKLMVEDV